MPKDRQIDALSSGTTIARGAEVGGWATNQAMNMHSLRAQSQVFRNSYFDAKGDLQQVASVQNVNVRAFYQNGTQWVDSSFDTNQKVVKVQAYSAAYFQIANASRRMAEYLAMGDDLVIAVNNNALQITPKAGRADAFTDDELKQLLGEDLHAAKPASIPEAPTGGSPLLFAALAMLAMGATGVIVSKTRRR